MVTGWTANVCPQKDNAGGDGLSLTQSFLAAQACRNGKWACQQSCSQTVVLPSSISNVHFHIVMKSTGCCMGLSTGRCLCTSWQPCMAAAYVSVQRLTPDG
jgi:hypothetical protein